MCEAIDAKAASLNLTDPLAGRATIYFEHGTDPVWTELLLARYAAMSPIGSAVLMAELDQPIGAFDFIGEDEYVESRFYREWCLPQGYYDMLGAIIAKRPSEVGAISATRTLEKGKFDDECRAYIGHIAPHVRRAVTISGLLERRALERDALVNIIDQLAAAVFLIDRTGRVERMNAAADALSREGQVASVAAGVLQLSGAEANAALAAALQHDVRLPRLIPAGDAIEHRCIAAVIEAEPKTGRFAVLINRQEADVPAIGTHLMRLFKLTPREVALLMPMLEGKTLEEIAGQLGISEATARSHLHRLFTKTGTNRQIDLVQAVMRALPPLRPQT